MLVLCFKLLERSWADEGTHSDWFPSRTEWNWTWSNNPTGGHKPHICRSICGSGFLGNLYIITLYVPSYLWIEHDEISLLLIVILFLQLFLILWLFLMLLHMQGLAWIFHILTHGFVQAWHENSAYFYIPKLMHTLLYDHISMLFIYLE